ncbi:MAG: TerB family tellurite resistance protein [Flavobacteriales bacterium]|nr:TerB family tellurite resistance protein [Flavobacteriales bacterium]
MEYEFIKVIALRLMVPIADFDDLFEKNIDFKPPKLEVNRILHFQRLVMMMNIDHEQSEEELNLIRDLGMRLALSTKATNQVLEEMNKYPNKVVPVERLIEIFQVFHN